MPKVALAATQARVQTSSGLARATVDSGADSGSGSISDVACTCSFGKFVEFVIAIRVLDSDCLDAFAAAKMPMLQQLPAQFAIGSGHVNAPQHVRELDSSTAHELATAFV